MNFDNSVFRALSYFRQSFRELVLGLKTQIWLGFRTSFRSVQSINLNVEILESSQNILPNSFLRVEILQHFVKFILANGYKQQHFCEIYLRNITKLNSAEINSCKEKLPRDNCCHIEFHLRGRRIPKVLMIHRFTSVLGTYLELKNIHTFCCIL